MLLYRFTNSSDPMSDWGHAMFAEDRLKVENYGTNGFVIDDAICIDIYDLHDDIIAAWEQYRKDNAGNSFILDFLEMDGEWIFESLAPINIVDSADGYDHDLTLQFFWDYVCDSKNIQAVRTPDGAIVFDADLIKPLQ